MDSDKRAVEPIAREFLRLGFSIISTGGTCAYLNDRGLNVERVNKLDQGRPHVEDAIKNGQVHLVINTGSGDTPSRDGYVIRRAALKYGLPYVTTIAGALALSKAVAAFKSTDVKVQCVQEYHRT
jgi:carbamoyl-phosphate synthase large subunit